MIGQRNLILRIYDVRVTFKWHTNDFPFDKYTIKVTDEKNRLMQ